MVVDGELRLKITPSDGWYCVEGLDVKGLVTQGRTIKEAIYMAHDAAQALAESRAIMAAR
jgi:predicted RNase H-like HicB family nuclease